MWRSIDPDDLEAVVELAQSCYAMDGGIGFLFEPEEIHSRYLPDQPGSRIGAFSPDGRLAACASVSIHRDPGRRRARIVGQVRPEVRGRGLGTALMQWSLEQAQVLLAGAGEPQKVMEVATESLTEPARRLYLARGFACVFEELVMEMDLRQPLQDRRLPPDVAITNWQPDLAEKFFQAYHASFHERPGFPGYRAAEWIAIVTENDHRPDWSLLARLGGEPAGFVIGNIDLSKDPPGGHIWQVGVVPSQRRRGLASALLVESMRRMQAGEAVSAFLTVHVNNPGAVEAYARLGFKTIGRRARFERAID